MILISFDTIKDKFDNLKAVQLQEVFSILGFSVESYWWYGFLMPVISAVLFIYAYPYAAIHALEYTIDSQEKVNGLRYRKRESELVDNARARELIKENSQLKIENEKIAFAAAEKEKSLTETINILEANIVRLNEQLAPFLASSAGEVYEQKSENKNYASYVGNGVDHDLPESSQSLDLVFKKIKDADYIWKRVADRVYSIQPNAEFRVSALFGPDVWDAYDQAQKSAIATIFRENFINGKYINLVTRVVDGEEGQDVYMVIPFVEYPNRKAIQDAVLAFMVPNNKPIRIEEFFAALDIRKEVVKNCLDHLLEMKFIRPMGHATSYVLTSQGRLYAEALSR
jgi:hypothetical protein